MSNTFWTPELLCEFFNSSPNLPPTLMNEVNLFKASKEPKKEWEVVAYRTTSRTGQQEKFYTRCADGKWRVNGEHGSYSDDEFTDGNIWSVRRLSDGEIFSVGDRADTPSCGQHIIRGFELEGADLIVAMGAGYIGFSAIKKLPAALFTTVDGKEICPGMEFWAVGRDFTISPFDPITASESDRGAWKGAKVFSTREAAENYIIQHKPCLSVEDVKSVMDDLVMSVEKRSPIMHRVKELVKSKLND